LPLCAPPRLATPPSSFLFFFYSHAAHRDLHSFPTRRSSDLGARGRPARDASNRSRRGYVRGPPRPWRPLCAAGARSAPRLRKARSEEHTSELQSLRHLVCRLLLEKKKKQKNMHITPPTRHQ